MPATLCTELFLEHLLLRCQYLANVGARPSPAVLQDRAETWRPWRAYGLVHLWAQASAMK